MAGGVRRRGPASDPNVTTYSAKATRRTLKNYLVDSDVIVDLLRDNEHGRGYRKFLAGHHLAVSIITYGEIYEGIYNAPDPERQEKGFLALLDAITVVNLKREIMQAFAMMRMELRKSGQQIGDLDTIIAATAYESGASLVTRNRKHFERIPGLILAPEP